MCRNIKPLYNFEPPATDSDTYASALQYVRKISGYNKPSKANEAAFNAAVEEIASATQKLLESLVTDAPPKDRAAFEAAKREKAAKRYA